MTELALEAHDIVRRFGAHEALRSVSLSVPRGELVGLVGPDGAGKTTMIRCLAGLLTPHAGTVRVLGAPPAASRERLGLMPQHYSLYGDLSIAENLRFFGRLFGLSHHQYATRTERLLHITRLAPFVDRRADALSGGMYKKLALACALLHEPDVLLLDEPTNGVDPVSRRELWDLLHDFVADGMAVLLATPAMDEAARCHRVVLLHEGRVLADGDPNVLVRSLEHPVLAVHGGDHVALEALLAARTDVLAANPTGDAWRIVVRAGRLDDVAAALAPLGATLTPARPDFEDLFLARTARATDPAAEPTHAVP